MHLHPSEPIRSQLKAWGCEGKQGEDHPVRGQLSGEVNTSILTAPGSKWAVGCVRYQPAVLLHITNTKPRLP